jgi:hypothetical protein
MLTEEERRKIYEEEKARLEARDELKRKAKSKSNLYGCLAFLAVGIALLAICWPREKSSSPSRQGKPELATGPSGQKYYKAPDYPLSPTTNIVPIIHVRNLLTVAASDIKGTLKKELGSSVALEFGENSWGGTGWTAKAALATIEVTPWKGRVLEVMVYFNIPVPDRAAALAYLDIQPCTQTPTIDAVGGATWEYAFSGIYQVIAAHVLKAGGGAGGGPGISVVTVIPSKALNDEFTDQN